MASVPFHYVDLRAFCYATEDEKRVRQALRTYLPEEAELERVETEGHHGDRILVFSCRLENADDVRRALDRLTDLDDLDAVVDELDHRVDDDCTFFLTLDKQAAFSGRAERGDGITLRGKVEAYPAKKPSAVENVRETLEGIAAGTD
jgi:RNA binding exosome subunit